VPSKSSGRVVIIAILVNLTVAVCKYVVATLTGSAAMLAEAFHSTADTGNELLLLVGMKRSIRPPDSLHPFGHGKALYFYSLLVAVYIFGFGGGLACYQGISRLRHPEPTNHVGWSYVVLAIAAALDFYSWRVSYKALLAQKSPDETTWDEIVGSKDPTIFTVFLEDSAGLAGAAVAFLGIFFGHLLHNPYLDPIASILIGILLGAIALLLGRESGALLVGERTNRSKLRRVREIIRNDKAVHSVGDLLTMQLGPDQALLNVDIRFRRDMDVRQLENAINRIEREIRRREPTIRRIFIEAAALRQKTKGSEAA
jgi:cation diffusion facilitator family transporter